MDWLAVRASLPSVCLSGSLSAVARALRRPRMRGEGEQKNPRLSKNPARATENPVRYPGDEERSCEKAFDGAGV